MLSVMLTAMVTTPAVTTKDRRGRPVVSMRTKGVDSEGKQFEVSLIAFYFEVQARLLKLKPGDEVAVIGHASLSKWDSAHNGGQVGLNVIARKVLTHDDAGPHVPPQDRPMGPPTALEEAASG